MTAGKRRLPTRSLLAAAVAAAAIAAAPAPAQGAGATYNVLNCHLYSRGGDDPGNNVQVLPRGSYTAQDKCTQGISDWSYQLKSAGPASGGQGARLHFFAPPGTAIVGYSLEHDMRTAEGHYADIAVVDFGGGAYVDYRAPNEPGGFRSFGRFGLDHHQVVIDFYCSRPGGCVQSNAAHAFVRNVELYLADAHDPAITNLGGSLLGGGWLRGGHRLVGTGADYGSGVEYLIAYVNEAELGGASTGCSAGNNYTGAFVPCPASAGFDLPRDTAQGPFHNGANKVAIKAEDFAGNVSWSSEHTVLVDNAQPELAFASGQDPADPELIRAPLSDAHSGVASAQLELRAVGQPSWQPLDSTLAEGELRARVDSASLPPGEYEFRATASDVAGNSVETTKRADGQPMRLTFPLRADVDLRAHLSPGGGRRVTVGYRRDAKAAGRLLDAGGEPMAEQEVMVIEDFGAGALISERVRTVTTDEKGRWRSTLPGGPSRSVSVHFAGTTRHLGDRKDAGRLRVRSKAKFGVSREQVPEGERVIFRGKVGHFGARIPPGGKLIELQAKQGAGRWQTVREAFRTRASGRYRLGYRFGRFYQADAVLIFRVKVAREGGWPYKAPTRSKIRKVIVRAG